MKKFFGYIFFIIINYLLISLIVFTFSYLSLINNKTYDIIWVKYIQKKLYFSGLRNIWNTNKNTPAATNPQLDTLDIISTTGINTDLAVGQAINVPAITAVNASTAYVNQITVDGLAITENWVGGSAPTDGGSSGYDTYSFNILKTGNETFICIANQVKTS